MVILVDKDTGYLVKDNFNAFPLNIRTADKITVSKTIHKNRTKNENDLFDSIFDDEKYKSKDEQTILNNASVFGDVNKMDEVLMEGEKLQIDNTIDYTATESLPLTPENYTLSNLEEIYYSECINLLNASQFDNVMVYLLDDIRIIGSSYLSYTKFKVVIAPEQKIFLDIKENILINNFEIYNISREAKVYLNNVEAIFDENKKCFVGTYNALAETVNIEIRNESDYVITACIPFMLY